MPFIVVEDEEEERFDEYGVSKTQQYGTFSACQVPSPLQTFASSKFNGTSNYHPPS